MGSVSVRFYLFADDGVQRIATRVMEGLVHGQNAMPQYAGTKQKVVDVVLELNDGKPARIREALGNYLTFDGKGQVRNSLIAGGLQAMETHDALARSKDRPASKVVDLSPKLNRDKWERENRWTPTKAELDLIADDIWKRKTATAVKIQQAKGAVQKPPKITYAAREALDEFNKHLYGIDGRLETLSEADLKGVAFEARERAEKESKPQLWLGLAASADLQREIRSRYRTGTGTWYAEINVISWDETHHSGETVMSKHEKCSSLKEAEVAARRLLVENSNYFSSSHTVEASVVSDLEWRDDS